VFRADVGLTAAYGQMLESVNSCYVLSGASDYQTRQQDASASVSLNYKHRKKTKQRKQNKENKTKKTKEPKRKSEKKTLFFGGKKEK
jgi:hypothetical protein